MPEGLLATRAVRKEYYEVVAVDDVDLSLPAGAIYGLIGPNGAGKTTLLRMLATTLEPTSGSVAFAGRDVWADPVAVRKRIGFMPDFFQMYNGLKVREILTYFGIAHGMDRAELRRRVPEVIDLIGLADKAEALCKGLSRGMVQRLGLGRAILHRPELLLLDEPASGLDPMGRRDLFDILRTLHDDGATVVISSHILAELSGVCTAVVIMDDGRILETGSTDEIIRKIMPTRKITVRFAAPADAGAILAAHAAVADLQAGDDYATFLFDADDAALAELNAALVRAGLPVARIEETQTDLHELYFKIAERNADAGLA